MELVGRLINNNLVSKGVLVNKTLTLKGNIGISGQPIPIGGEIYEGPYTVTPKAHESTVLQTQLKVMSNDVTVLEVPYFEVSNVSGKTAYIAQEVNIDA